MVRAHDHGQQIARAQTPMPVLARSDLSGPAAQLEGHPVVQKHKQKPLALKSSLKGSKSQLSLEELAQAARRHSAIRNARLVAQTTLQSLLQGINDVAEVGSAFHVGFAGLGTLALGTWRLYCRARVQRS
jgi:hypothetical protein